MKKGLLVLSLAGLLIACNQDAPSPTTISEENRIQEVAEEPVKIPSLVITPLQEELVDVYGGVALIDLISHKTIAFVNQKAGKGAVIINNKEYPLTSVGNNDGQYSFKGEGIEIFTTSAQYKEMEADCNYGYLDKVTITYKNAVKELSNIQVQDCAHLGQ